MGDWKVYNAAKKPYRRHTMKTCPKCGTAHTCKTGAPCPWCGFVDNGKNNFPDHSNEELQIPNRDCSV